MNTYRLCNKHDDQNVYRSFSELNPVSKTEAKKPTDLREHQDTDLQKIKMKNQGRRGDKHELGYQLSGNTGNKYVILITGKKLKCHEDIITSLLQQVPGLKEVQTVEDCDFILVLCTSVSRAGTDIEAALKELNTHSESKPAILMVLHHTFDPEKIVADSSRCVNRVNTLTVDCLFHEDKGLLKCRKNKEALDRLQQLLQPQGYASSLLSNYLPQPVHQIFVFIWISATSLLFRTVMFYLQSVNWMLRLTWGCANSLLSRAVNYLPQPVTQMLMFIWRIVSFPVQRFWPRKKNGAERDR